MSELNAGFQSLPSEYQHVIQLVQEQQRIHVASLQTLVSVTDRVFASEQP